jgi:CheY-like chemotaxis protein
MVLMPRDRFGHAGTQYVDVPVIAMTVNALNGDKEACLDVGMLNYIYKPIEFDTFETVLEK